MRGNRRGGAETFQALAAITVVLGCAGLVLAAAHAASLHAAETAARERAELQAEIVLGALADDPAIAGADGIVLWTGLERVAAGSAELTFLPGVVKVVTARAATGGPELFLVGSALEVASGLVFASQPVPIAYPNGTVAPGVLRVGVAVR